MCSIKVGSAASVKSVCQASLKAEQEHQTAVCSVSEGCVALVEAAAALAAAALVDTEGCVKSV